MIFEHLNFAGLNASSFSVVELGNNSLQNERALEEMMSKEWLKLDQTSVNI